QHMTYGVLIGFAVLIFAVLLQSMYSTDPFAPGLADFIPLPASWQRTLAHPANIADSMGRKGWEPIVDAASSASSVATSVTSAVPSAASSVMAAPVVKIADLINMHFALPGGSNPEDKAVIVRDEGEGKNLALSMWDEKEYLKQDEKARHWHELNDEEQNVWRKRLIDAGHWTVEEGETILKGVVFSSWAGFVGRVAGEVIREL
ncbi:hypothetical protein KCU73_g6574, partial [Aureobasidium melanogenum]